MSEIDRLQLYKIEIYIREKAHKKIQKLREEYKSAEGGQRMRISKIIKELEIEIQS